MQRTAFSVIQGLRPFSLCVALINCGLGVALAIPHPAFSLLPAFLVMIAGLLLQAGVNLINDFGDRHDWSLESVQYQAIMLNARIAAVLFAIAALLGGYLVLRVGWPLLVLILVGALGALGYTLEPINYKRRGLAVLLVFWLMGVFMVVGSYLAITGYWPLQTWLLSIPVSLLTSLLLLSNELRDFEVDQQQGLGTLTVRIGYPASCRLFVALLLMTALVVILFAVLGWLREPYWLLLSLILLPGLLRLLKADSEHRQGLTRQLGRFYMLFGLLYIWTLISGQTLWL